MVFYAVHFLQENVRPLSFSVLYGQTSRAGNLLPTWEVDLNVFGPVSVTTSVHLREPKGFSLHDPFQSDVKIKTARGGVQITATAYAATLQSARKVTLVFIGYMLDALTLHINMPLFLSYTSSRDFRDSYPERRHVTENEWHDAFREARLLSLAEPTFLRALGWYRKGMHSDDALLIKYLHCR